MCIIFILNILLSACMPKPTPEQVKPILSIIETFQTNGDGVVTFEKDGQTTTFHFVNEVEPSQTLEGINVSISYQENLTSVYIDDPTGKYFPKFVPPSASIFDSEQRYISLSPVNEEGYMISSPFQIEIDLKETDLIIVVPMSDLFAYLQDNSDDGMTVVLLSNDPASLSENADVYLYSSQYQDVIYARMESTSTSSFLDWTASPAYAEPITIGAVLVFLGKAAIHLIEAALIIDHMTKPVGVPEDYYFDEENLSSEDAEQAVVETEEVKKPEDDQQVDEEPAEMVTEDPNGCDNPELTSEERANCGEHTYHRYSELTKDEGYYCPLRENGSRETFTEMVITFDHLNLEWEWEGEYENMRLEPNVHEISYNSGGLEVRNLYTFRTDGFTLLHTRKDEWSACEIYSEFFFDD